MNDYNVFYYESSDIERVVLAETIELPKLMKFPKEKLNCTNNIYLNKK